MPFTPVTYNTGAAPGLDGPAFNALQTQYSAAINAFERDLLTPFVFSGLVATKDGTTLSQLDVTAGVAFLIQSDGQSELYRVAPVTSTQSTTGNPTTTMYLDLNPDGSWSWGTAHSAQANYLTICTVTTDASANIATVTDTRTLNTTLLSGMAGLLALPGLHGVSVHPLNPASSDDAIEVVDRNGVNGALLGWGSSGQGLYAWDQVNSGYIFQYGTHSGITFLGQIHGAIDNALALEGWNKTGHGIGAYDNSTTMTLFPYDASTGVNVSSCGITLQGMDASGVGHTGLIINTDGSVDLGTIRNGVTTVVPIYTGANTPSSPPTGSVWLNK